MQKKTWYPILRVDAMPLSLKNLLLRVIVSNAIPLSRLSALKLISYVYQFLWPVDPMWLSFSQKGQHCRRQSAFCTADATRGAAPPHSKPDHPKLQTWCDRNGLFQSCLFVETCFAPQNQMCFLFYKIVKSNFSTWLTHLTLRFLYILGCSGPRCAAGSGKKFRKDPFYF